MNDNRSEDKAQSQKPAPDMQVKWDMRLCMIDTSIQEGVGVNGNT